MKKNILYSFILLLLAGPGEGVAQQVSWYKSFTGTIGKYPVTLHVHKMGHKVAGYYYYHTRMQPIYMIGNDTSAGAGNIKLYCYSGDEVFTLAIKNDICKGQWKKVKKARQACRFQQKLNTLAQRSVLI